MQGTINSVVIIPGTKETGINTAMTRTVFALLVGGIAAFFAFHKGANPVLWWVLGAIIFYWIMSAPPWLDQFKLGWLEFEPSEAEVVGDVRLQGFHVRYRGAPMGFVYPVALGWRGTLGSFKTPIYVPGSP